MLNYILKRLFLIIPTLLGILAVNFIIIQAAPGGPQLPGQAPGHQLSFLKPEKKETDLTTFLIGSKDNACVILCKLEWKPFIVS